MSYLAPVNSILFTKLSILLSKYNSLCEKNKKNIIFRKHPPHFSHNTLIVKMLYLITISYEEKFI